ncbi:hypothetical protein BJ165DRAFT_1450484 [Panaeolus papilionaceus]|nr:hypothetical protein BJ165DRAFT_1450484 [Panaeolus papilionaceus]
MVHGKSIQCQLSDQRTNAKRVITHKLTFEIICSTSSRGRFTKDILLEGENLHV